MNKNNIVLIGFMGSGKTTFGKWIEANKGKSFSDTDELIEANQGKSINEIFANEGEEYFRGLETACVETLIKKVDNAVISVGGGLPVREINRELLKELGVVVYLNATKEELVKRLQGDTKRPLLKGGNLEEKITGLMNARKAIYESVADVIVDTQKLDFEEMYQIISEFIKEREQ